MLQDTEQPFRLPRVSKKGLITFSAGCNSPLGGHKTREEKGGPETRTRLAVKHLRESDINNLSTSYRQTLLTSLEIKNNNNLKDKLKNSLGKGAHSMRSQDSADYKIGNETYSSPPTATQNSPT